jgi:hypothetical protein
MALLRIREVKALESLKLRLTLTDSSVIERDVSRLLVGPIFELIRRDANVFGKVRVEAERLSGRTARIYVQTS